MNGELIWVLSLLAIAVVLFATGKVRMDAVALFVIVAFVLSGTLTLPEAFSGFSDPNVILIAALFIIGDGLVRTGVATVVGTWLVKMAGSSEIKMLVLLMITVAGLGAFMSSTGVVAMAASAAFMTPVSSPVNTLVLGPGNYSFSDFVKLGVPFTLIVMAVCIVMIPMLFPF